jgi:tRNA A37 threonylcarbamoyladenosine biosynthesis protein TsaE
VCRALGVPSRVPIQSPTFALVHEHEGATAAGAKVRIVHADLYRLTAAGELDELGLSELLEGAVGLVEWGLRFAEPIAKDGVALELTLGGAGLERHVPRDVGREGAPSSSAFVTPEVRAPAAGAWRGALRVGGSPGTRPRDAASG